MTDKAKQFHKTEVSLKATQFKDSFFLIDTNPQHAAHTEHQ